MSAAFWEDRDSDSSIFWAETLIFSDDVHGIRGSVLDISPEIVLRDQTSFMRVLLGGKGKGKQGIVMVRAQPPLHFACMFQSLPKREGCII